MKKLIKELKSNDLNIPDYQRGYKWHDDQITDFLNDINMARINNKESYNLQLLAINPKCKNVIDGQQRLTTTFLILKALGCECFCLTYETRLDSKKFLNDINKTYKNIDKTTKEDFTNSDYYYISHAYIVIKKYLNEKIKGDIDSYMDYIVNHCYFIWYEIKCEKKQDEIKAFNQINSGKIALNDAELIKATILNENTEEFAQAWDNIELGLQDNKLFYFIYGYDGIDLNTVCDSRIIYLFQMLINYMMKIHVDMEEGKRNVYNKFLLLDNKNDIMKTNDISKMTIEKLYSYINSWYSDIEIYHLIGYMIWSNLPNCDINSILSEYCDLKNKCKSDFYKELIRTIKDNLCLGKYKIDDFEKIRDIIFDNEFEYNNEKYYINKTESKKLLLLFNIISMIIKNRAYKEDIFNQIFETIKFPFNLLKMEKWDVEHIASKTDNNIEKTSDRKEFLYYSYHALDNYQKVSIYSLKDEIKKVYKDESEINNDVTFNKIKEKIFKHTENNDENSSICDDEKDKLWNFTLLNSKINRGYGNALFFNKREWIIYKDNGKKPRLPEEIDDEINYIDDEKSFIPESTKNVFLKYYSLNSSNNLSWSVSDAESYINKIISVFKEYFMEQKQ